MRDTNMLAVAQLETKSARIETRSADENGDFAELRAAFDTYHGQVKSLSDGQKAFEKRLEEVINERLDQIEMKNNRPRVSKDGLQEIEAKDEQNAFGQYIKAGDDRELRALNTGDDSEAGYLVATQFSNTINKKIFDQSPIRRLARVIPLEGGADWAEPVDFSDVGAEWVGETQERTETERPKVGMLNIKLCEIYAHQTVTQKLLDTSYLKIGEWIQGKIADKFARSEGSAYVVGTGVNQPKGFLNYPTSALADAPRPLWTLQTINSGHATEVTADGLRDMFWGLRAPYRGNASWLMSSATANKIDKLKDGNGDYLWRDAMSSGAAPSLLGRPVEIDENMPPVEAGTTPIAFGDFKQGYTIIDRNSIKPLRDPYSDKPNVIFYVYKRTGGGVSNSEAIKLLKIAAN